MTQGLGLYAKLICDQAGVIDYQKGHDQHRNR